MPSLSLLRVMDGGFTNSRGRASTKQAWVGISSGCSSQIQGGGYECLVRRADGGWRMADGDRVVTAETVSKLCLKGLLDQAVEALELVVQAGHCNVKSVLYTILKKCVVKTDPVLGSRVIACTMKKGLRADTFLRNHILRMHASQGRLHDAMDVFEGLSKPDAFTWSAIISAHVKHGHDKQAIQLYHRMRRSGVKPDGHVFVAALQACARAADLESGRQVHAHVLAAGVEPDMFFHGCLLDMYAKCGSLVDARRAINGLRRKDAVTWTAMIAGYTQQGLGRKLLGSTEAVRLEGNDAAPHVLISNIYTNAQIWNQAEEMQARRKRIRAWKQPGQSWWIDEEGLVHSFSVGEENHPQCQSQA